MILLEVQHFKSCSKTLNPTLTIRKSEIKWILAIFWNDTCMEVFYLIFFATHNTQESILSVSCSGYGNGMMTSGL